MNCVLTVALAVVLAPQEVNTCGVDAVAACLSGLGIASDRDEIASISPRSGVNLSLREMSDVLRSKYNISSCALDGGFEASPLGVPAILPVVLPGKIGHFVAIVEQRAGRYLVKDGDQSGWMTVSDLRAGGWAGVQLLVGPNADKQAMEAWYGRWASYLAIAISVGGAGLVWHNRLRLGERLGGQSNAV